MKKPAMTKASRVERVIDGLSYSKPALAVWVGGGIRRYGFSVEELKRAEVAIAIQLAEDAPIGGEAFQWMRKSIRLKGAELGEILGVRAETVSRWERGDVEVTRAAWLWLCGAVLEANGKKPALVERGRELASK